jgi:tetratricopeptide (TPR) repeat protein
MEIHMHIPRRAIRHQARDVRIQTFLSYILIFSLAFLKGFVLAEEDPKSDQKNGMASIPSSIQKEIHATKEAALKASKDLLPNIKSENQQNTSFYFDDIERTWKEILKYLDAQDISAVNDKCFYLEELREKYHLKGFQEYSFFFIEKAHEKVKEKDIELAAFFLKKALQLSPSAPQVLFSSLSLIPKTGVGSIQQTWNRILNKTYSSNESLFRLGLYLFEIVFWSLYSSVYVFFIFSVCAFATNNFYAKELTKKQLITGVFRLTFLFTLPIASLFFGPLAALLSLALCFKLIDGKRSIMLFASCLIIFCGLTLPLEENIKYIINDKKLLEYTRISDGLISGKSLDELASFRRVKSFDFVYLYTLGKFYRMNGNYDLAKEIFEEGLKKFPSVSLYYKFQLAIVYQLMGQIDEALKNMQSVAEHQDFFRFQTLYNLSKLQALKLEMEESEKSFREAMKLDGEQVDFLTKLEEKHGTIFAEIDLKKDDVLLSLLNPSKSIRENYNQSANELLKGSSVPIIVFTGIGLFLLSLLRKRKFNHGNDEILLEDDQKKTLIIQRCLVYLPAGGWILRTEAGVSVRFLLLFSVFTLFVTGWEKKEIIPIAPLLGVTIYILCALIILWILSIYLAVKEEKL